MNLVKRDIFIFLIFLWTTGLSEHLHAGGWSGSGGDATSGLFKTVCKGIAQAILGAPEEEKKSDKSRVNWQTFESNCEKIVAFPAYKSNTKQPEWEDLKDLKGIPRVILFIQKNKSIAIHGPRFVNDFKTNPLGTFVTVIHEMLKYMELNDEENGISAEISLTYPKSLADLARKLKPIIEEMIQADNKKAQKGPSSVVTHFRHSGFGFSIGPHGAHLGQFDTTSQTVPSARDKD